jgi:hypothetical protein
MAHNNHVLLYRVPRAAFFTCALLLSACGSDESTAQTSSSASEPLDPCALVTETEAAEAMGAQTSESDRPSEANNKYLATCRYVAPRGLGLAVMTILLHGRQYGRMGFRTAGEQPFDKETVAGVGDEAFRIGDPLNTLYVLKGDHYFTIGGNVEPDQARLLAMKATERLP